MDVPFLVRFGWREESMALELDNLNMPCSDILPTNTPWHHWKPQDRSNKINVASIWADIVCITISMMSCRNSALALP